MSYYQEAAKVFEQIQSQGMGTYDTDYNLSVLYQNMQQYDQEETVLNQMLEKYGDNYKTYKALAYPLQSSLRPLIMKAEITQNSRNTI